MILRDDVTTPPLRQDTPLSDSPFEGTLHGICNTKREVIVGHTPNMELNGGVVLPHLLISNQFLSMWERDVLVVSVMLSVRYATIPLLTFLTSDTFRSCGAAASPLCGHSPYAHQGDHTMHPGVAEVGAITPTC